MASAGCSRGNCWSLTFEIEDSQTQDLNLSANRALIRDLLKMKVFHSVGAAITCRSFSRAVRPPVRSRRFPAGLEGISSKMFKKVSEGNQQSLWLSQIVVLCKSLGVHFWIENPDQSFLWRQVEWVALGALQDDCCLRVVICALRVPRGGSALESSPTCTSAPSAAFVVENIST